MKHGLFNTTASAAALALVATSAGALELNVASGLAVDHVLERSTHGALMACVTERTGGEITFNYYPSGQIVSIREGVEALEQGLADIAYISPINQGARMPLTGLSILPGLGNNVTDFVHAFRKVLDGDNPIAAEARGFNIRPLIINVLPPYQIVRNGPPVTSIDGFRGMLTRTAGSSMLLTINAIGAVPVEMTAGDVYVGMQRGTVEATMFSTISVPTYRLEELIKSMSRNANFGTSVTYTAISDASWEKLTPEQQTILAECSAENEEDVAVLLDEMDASLYDDFVAEQSETMVCCSGVSFSHDASLIAV